MMVDHSDGFPCVLGDHDDTVKCRAKISAGDAANIRALTGQPEVLEEAVARVAHEVYEAWRVTADRDAHVEMAIRAAASQGADAALAGRTVVDPAAIGALANQIRLLDECSGCHDVTDVATHAAQAVRDFAARGLASESSGDGEPRDA